MRHVSCPHGLLLLLVLVGCDGSDKAVDTPRDTGTSTDTDTDTDSETDTDTDTGSETDTDTDSDSGSDSDSDSDSDTADSGALVTLSGAVAKGPFIRGSSVSVSPLDDAGAPTGELYATVTDDDAGHFGLDLDIDGPVAIEAQGYYYNEVTGRLSTAPITLRSYHSIVTAGEAVAFVNTFTHLTSLRVAGLLSAGASVEDAVTLAESEALLQLHIGPATFVPGADGGSMDLLGGDDDANAYLFALSTVLAQYAVNTAGEDGPVDATLSEVLNGLAADLEDGALDGGGTVPTGAELYALQATIDADAVMELLASRFAAIGSDAEVPDLHRVFDLDVDGTVDLDDTDADADGYMREGDGGSDCDDYDPSIHPGATEDFYDGVDVDCTDDSDGDGYTSPEAGGTDCDDGDPEISPGEVEIWYDGVDQDCGADDDFDQDGDGFDAASGGGDDCDDLDAETWPGADEVWYDGIDQDCGSDDDYDQDGDGVRAASGGGEDCDDLDVHVLPGAAEIWYDGVDQDCDGASDDDQDGDGADSDDHGGDDCDDLRASVHVGATETCSTSYDDDCDGDDNDEGATGCTTWHADVDDDGFGSSDSSCICSAEGAYTATNTTDCDDANGEAYPGATEVWYDGVDEACDGGSDDDQDGDGADSDDHGGDDCDDLRASVHVGATETCSTSYDDDCDGDDNDEGATGCSTWHADVDDDGFGSSDSSCICASEGAYTATNTTDCDDANGEAYPGAAEVWYDGVDEACDGGSDDDQDGDGADGDDHGGDDCDDLNASVHVGATETCSTSYDDDCDGDDNDEGATGCTTRYEDLDDDTFGSNHSSCACSAEGAYTASNRTDCDDADGEAWPGAAEVWYDGVDQACDGGSDDDQDGDGEDAATHGGADCDDEEPSVYPGAPERCSTAADDDCDGGTNDPGAVGCSNWMTDEDLDGYGSSDSLCLCEATSEYTVSNDDDCDDADATVNPSADEACWSLEDTDCDGDDIPCISYTALSSATARFGGEGRNDYAGRKLAGGGDVNGDGLADFLVGSTSQTSGSQAGASYLVLGASSLSSKSLSGANAKYSGKANDYAFTVGMADLDGDDYDDVLVGAQLNKDAAPTSSFGPGALYIVYGSPSPSSISVGSADLKLTGEAAGESAGGYVSGVGDVDGDSYEDLLIGSNFGSTYPGGVYLVLGSSSMSSGSLSTADAEFTGTASGDLAQISAGGGDIDGDGLDDMLVGAPRNDDGGSSSGSAYLILGSASLSSGLLSAVADTHYVGGSLEKVGASLAVGGDVDGDGYADFLVGAPNDYSAGYFTGAAYLMSGASGGWSTSKLSDAKAKFVGTVTYDCEGSAVDLGGDVNADGFDDVLVGRNRNDCSGISDVPGYADLYIGSPDLSSMAVTAADATYTGENNADMAGFTVAITGDVDGNGYDDLLVSAIYYTPSGALNGGAVYLMLSGL